jgi:hypothetical protein
MKSLRLIIFLTLSALLLSACGFKDLQFQEPLTGSGRVITEQRSAGSIERIQMSGFGELVVSQGDAETLSVEGEDNLLPYFLSDVSGHTLELHQSPFFTYQSAIPVRFHLTVRNLKSIELSGFAKVTVQDLSVKDLSVRMRQFSQLAFSGLRTDSLRGEISGFSRLSATGQVASRSIAQQEQAVAQVDSLTTR